MNKKLLLLILWGVFVIEGCKKNETIERQKESNLKTEILEDEEAVNTLDSLNANLEKSSKALDELLDDLN